MMPYLLYMKVNIVLSLVDIALSLVYESNSLHLVKYHIISS